MKVLLAYRAPEEWADDPQATALPSGLRSIAARLQADGHETIVANFSRLAWKQVERYLADAAPKLVGVSCFTFNRHAAVRLSRLARRACPDAKVVLGGPHASAMPELLLRRVRELDAVAVGEGEETMATACRRVALEESLDLVAGLATRASGAGSPRLSGADALRGAVAALNGAGLDPARDMRHVAASRRRGEEAARRTPSSVVAEIAELRAEFGVVDVALTGPALADARWLNELAAALLQGEHAAEWEIPAEPEEIASPEGGERLLLALLAARDAGLRRVRFVLEDERAAAIETGVLSEASRVLRAAGVDSHLTLRIGGHRAGLGGRWLSQMRSVVRALRPQSGDVEARALFPATPEWDAVAAEEGLDASWWLDEDRAVVTLVPEGAIERASAALTIVFREVARESLPSARDLTALQGRGESARMHLDWGDFRTRHDDAAEAERHYRLAAQLQPWSPFPWLRLATLFRRGKGHRELESAALKQVIAKVPRHAPSRERLDEMRRESERTRGRQAPRGAR